ncbi:enoyl-CoA hydratase [Mesorhizobium sangaii]|uniref:Enoyl-CoA hydratase/carnithine racemase n=1 Tax=Mesorhizobium sangaii TaxID=505389 RepID=A0A841NXI6_9HYPH|nr:enoyl-CoA hydratase [Mesorhizobium sangaii]MBB6407784.1 enoyl-CoA hydratase/carnithine racemase [Mesorhizobium sangaii]
MTDILTERSGGILRVELNRPEKKNAMTGAMYTQLANILIDAAKDGETRVVLWHGAGDDFCAGNDAGEFLKAPPGPGESPQTQLMHAFVGFEKPIVAAVQGAAVGGGTTMLTHCDVVYAGEGARFQLPFINLALTPEFGSSYSLPARIGHLRAAELFLLGERFSAARAAELGLVTRVVPDDGLFATAMETAQKLAAKPGGALQASKRLLKRGFIDQIKAAIDAEGQEFAERLRSADTKEALSAFLKKRPPNFTKTSAMAAE